jgi:flagellar motor switch protein FliN/FliY
MTHDEAVIQLARSTAEAVASVLTTCTSEDVASGQVAVVPKGTSPLEQVDLPAVAVAVSYTHGATGGNVFSISNRGAHRLAAAMMGKEVEDEDGELDELALSAVGEAMNQMMAAAAAATTKVLGAEVEIGPPQTHFLATPEDARRVVGEEAHTTSASFTVCGESCRLIQLIPNGFVVRMTRALDDLSTIVDPGASGEVVGGGLAADALLALPVRVSAELGAARLPIGRAIGLPRGAVVELDRRADDPIELFVNGRRFATGRLLLADDGEWAVEIERVFEPERTPQESHEGGDTPSWPEFSS